MYIIYIYATSLHLDACKEEVEEEEVREMARERVFYGQRRIAENAAEINGRGRRFSQNGDLLLSVMTSRRLIFII